MKNTKKQEIKNNKKELKKKDDKKSWTQWR